VSKVKVARSSYRKVKQVIAVRQCVIRTYSGLFHELNEIEGSNLVYRLCIASVTVDIIFAHNCTTNDELSLNLVAHTENLYS